jgi:acyl dehydratase
MTPVLLRCDTPFEAQLVHEIEAFGPVATLMPYRDVRDAISLCNRGGGNLVMSLFTHDPAVASDVIGGSAAFHGRVLIADRDCAKGSTGDNFYAHMDEEAAAAKPFFPGRVAQGYRLLSVAAGLFVDAAPGPVLANDGLDNLRFLKPVSPGYSIKVKLTAKAKNQRNETYGELSWAALVSDQNGETVASYDLLTMNAI